MFTLKLFRRHPHVEGIPNTKMHMVMVVDHVVVSEIGNQDRDEKALEIQTFQADGSYDTYYVGVPDVGMDAYGKDDLHLGSGPYSWWGWGLLENSAGKTTEHYRPASYG